MSKHARPPTRSSARVREILARACIEPLETRRLLTATLTNVHTFNYNDGAGPTGGLISDASGNLYGTTTDNSAANGGGNGGTVFELNPATQVLTTLATFSYGVESEGGLLMDSHGNLFGTTNTGGSNGEGTIFEVVANSGTATTLASFGGVDENGGTLGTNPVAGLIADSSGNLYGTTEYGGADNRGTVFEFTPGANAPVTLASFDSFDNGAEPQGGLYRDSAGDLFGTTGGTDSVNGGAGEGTVFELAAGSNAPTTLYDFTGTNGGNPTGNLVADAAGNLYGTTTYGGTGSDGTVFKVAAANHGVTTIASVPGTLGAGPSSPVLDLNGDVFAATNFGGNPNNYGHVFEVVAGSGVATDVYGFAYPGTNGESPEGPLVADSAGNLYGVTAGGGTDNDGTVFQLAGSGYVVPTITVTEPTTYQDANAGQAQSFDLGSFTATNTTAPYTVTVNWGDGSANTTFSQAAPGTIPQHAHTYDGTGYPYKQITVTVTDSAGTKGAGSSYAYVVPTPVVTPPANQSSTPGTAAYYFNLGSFTEAGGGGPYDIDVNWGDGTAHTTFTANAPGTIAGQTHAYAAAGNDTVTVTVTDTDNGTSGAATFTIDVGSVAVTPPADQAATTNVSQSFTLGSFTEANATAPYTVTVDWHDADGPYDSVPGSGSDDTTFTMNGPGTITPQPHAFPAAGDYYVDETVTDSDGHSGDAQFTVSVSDPVASITVTPPANQSATAQQAQSFNLGSFTESNATAPYTVDVAWGDGTADTTFTMNAAGTITPQSHTYASSGNDTVSVTVSDSASHTSNTATFTAAVAPPVITIGYTPPAEQSAVAGTAKTFDLGSFTESNAPAPYTLTVTWGDGSPNTTFTMNAPGTITPQSHTYADPGTEPVTMNIADADGDALNEQGFDIDVAAAPSITVNPPANQSATAGAAHSFALGSFADTNATAPYTVDVSWGDGTADTTFTANAAGTIAPQSHTYASAGSDTVSVTVTDSDGVTSNTATFTANPASITVTPASSAAQHATAGTTQVFNLGSFAETNATAPYSVDVNWGDGSADSTFTQNAPGAISSDIHTYSSSGTDTVSVTVTDANGVTSTGGAFTVDVAPAPVSITVTAPANQSATAGLSQSYSLGSFSESNATAPYTVDVAWGDGTADTTFTMNAAGTITPQSHTYADAGTPQVSVTVTDSANHTSNTATFTATVANQASLTVSPPADQFTTTGALGGVALGTLSESNATAPYTIDVSWGDGTADTTFTVNAPGTLPSEDHTYASDGTYTVSVTATDSANHASGPATFTVTSESPTIAAIPPANQSATAGQSQSFNLGSFSETGDSSPYTVDVNWGDGTPDTTFTMNAPGTITPQSHTFTSAPATDTVSVIVSSEVESSSPATFTVTVAPAPSITVTPPADQNATTGVAQSFNLGSFAETGATGPYTVTVNWDDGSAQTTFTMNAPGTITPQTHTFAQQTSYDVSVSVTDSASHESGPGIFTVNATTAPSLTATPPADQSAVEGDAQTFNLGSFTEGNATAPYTVDVDWGDGLADTTFTTNTPGTIAPQAHQYNAVGSDTVSVTVTDSANHTSNIATFTVSVAAVTITATPPADQTATEGTAQQFSLGSFTESNATGPYSVTVYWGGDSAQTTFTMNAPGTITPQSHTYTTTGTVDASVVVTDSADHTSNTAGFTVDVAAPETPTITYTAPANQTAVEGVSQSFALGSIAETDAAGPYEVQVDWGDGGPDGDQDIYYMSAAGTITPESHGYGQSGSYTVGVLVLGGPNYSVTSNYGSFTVVVGGVTITATPPANQPATAGTAQSFALGSFTEQNATAPYTVSVNWGDNTTGTFTMNAPGTIPPESHTYASAGSDTVGVYVTDADGNVSNEVYFTATVAPATSVTVTPPAAQTATNDVSQTFALGSFAQTSDTGPYSVDVAWGDGSPDTTFTMNAAGTITPQAHTYDTFNTPFNEFPLVTVTDTTGHQGSGGFTVTVQAPATTITVTPAGNQTATTGQAQSFALGSFTESNATGPYTVDVNWGDDGADTTFTMNGAGAIPAASHTYGSAGNDTVSVTVTDSVGHTSNVGTFTATVTNPVTTITLTPPADQSATAGAAQSFSLGSFTESNATGPYTVSVVWGDQPDAPAQTYTMNGPGTITPETHTYAASGSYSVSVTVTDSASHASNTASFNVNVAPAPVPSITLTGPGNQTATKGDSQSFSLGSFTESNATAPYTVSVAWGDGTYGTYTMSAAGTVTPEAHTYTTSGQENVEVYVTDADGTVSNAVDFTVNVVPPTVTITLTPPAGQSATQGVGQSFALGSFTESNATGPYTVSVNWGDGAAPSQDVSTFTASGPGTIAPAAHDYGTAGQYTASVTVTDAGGNTSNSGQFTVNVAAPVTTITVTPPAGQTATAGTAQQFALGSFTESNATGPYSVTVTWGDGSAATTFTQNGAGSITPQSHTYAAAGSDTVSVLVTDADGHVSNTATFTNTVNPAPTTITVSAASGQSATAGQAQSFLLGSFTEANATAPYTVDVSWGDGTADTTFTMNGPGTIPAQPHDYAASGNDTVTVTVSDSAGHTSNGATFHVAVVPVSAVITVTAPADQTATAGAAQTFALGSFTENGATAPYTVTVDWGDGSADTTFTANAPGTIPAQAHAYADPGHDTVSVTVADADGNQSNTATFGVTVATQATNITVTAAPAQTATAGIAQSFALGSFAETNATAPYTVSVDWGDGSADTTFTVNAPGTITPQVHTYAAGSDTVSVTVTDSAGHVSNAPTFGVTVTPQPTSLTVTAAAAQSATAGEAQSFALGAFSEANATAPYTVTVNWGDGTAATTFTMNGAGTITPQVHTFAAAGPDTVSVTVSDSAEHTSNTATFGVTVVPQPVTLTVTAPANAAATAGVSQSFALGSFAETNATAPYTVTVNWGDGTAATTFTMNGAGTITPQPHTYAAEGTDTVSVTVVDSAGNTSNTATFTANVSPQPVTTLAVTPPGTQSATPGVSQSFALGTFAESNGTAPYTVTVNWGDGTAATTFTMNGGGTIAPQSHTYAAAAVDTVSVTVADSAGHTSNTATFTADVANPTATITVSAAAAQSATAGVSQSFSLGSFVQTNGTAPYTVTVNWGDASPDTTFTMNGAGAITPQVHTYADAGSDTVSVTVTDADGNASNTPTFAVTVAPQATTLTVTAAAGQSATKGVAQTFALGGFTETNATAPYTVTVNWGDGTAATTFTMNGAGTITPQSHTYAAVGTDTVTVTVADSADHTSNAATFVATVSAQAGSLTASAAAGTTATKGVAQSFALGSFAETNATAPYTVTVNWGDGSANTTFTMNGPGTITPQTHTYAVVGTDAISVTVTDAVGDTSNTATSTVNVIPAPVTSLTVTPPADQSALTGVSQEFALGTLAESNATAPYTVTVNWGDGTAATTFTQNGPGTITPQSHTFAAVGTDTVSVTVVDSAGNTSNTATFTATVARPPVSISVSAATAQSATAGASQSFSLGSFAETNAVAPYTVMVDWGDGSPDTTFAANGPGTIAPQSHTYASAGPDTVSVTVADADGDVSNTATFIATVQSPVTSITLAAAGAQTATTNTPQSFSLGSFSESNATAPYTVTVNWGDGTAATTFTMNGAGTIAPQSHTYTTAGQDTVSVVVTDAASHSSNTATFTATVTAPATSITVAAAGGQSATAGVAQAFALGSFAAANATAPYTVTVNWGDGTANTTFSIAAPGTITPQTHTYAAAGSDSVSVTVTDSAGHTSNSATFLATVVPPVGVLTVTPPPDATAVQAVSQSFALGSFTETNGTAPYTITVDWGDGSADATFTASGPGTIAPQAHVFADVGTDTVSVTVADAAGDTSAPATFTVTVAPPEVTTLIVTPAADQSAQPGVAQSFALGSLAETNGVGPYTVSVVWGDLPDAPAQTFTMNGPGTIAPEVHTYAADGSYGVSVTVTDADGHTSNTADFTILVAPPAAVITVTAPGGQTATTGVDQSFALGSFAETNATGPYTVTVNWGDDSTATTFTMNGPGTIAPQPHDYGAAGPFTVSVTVADADGDTSNPATFQVNVTSPVASLTVAAAGNQSAIVGVAQTFSLGTLAESNATAPYTVTVNWGDGSAATTFTQNGPGTIAPQSHTYAAVGTDTVSVTVTDADGNASNTATFTASVATLPASLTLTAASAQTATVGTAQSFALGSFAESNATAPYTVAVNWGDGSAVTTFTVNAPGTITPQAHTFATAGPDTVSVTVTDSADHTSNTATFAITVVPQPVTLTVTAPAAQSAPLGVAQSFVLGTFAETNATAPYTVTVNWGDGSAATAFTMNGPGTITPQSHAFVTAGSDTVSVTVADSAGHTSNTATFTVSTSSPIGLTVTAPAGQTASASVPATFALGSFAESGATAPYTVTVNWGDGTGAATFTMNGPGTITPEAHTFAAMGTDTVSVTVTDSADHVSNTATFAVTVVPQPVTLTVTAPGAQSATVGTAQSFALGSVAETNATAPYTVTVNWGDGTAATTFTMNGAGTITPQAHTYAADGTDTVSVTVVDSAGNTSNTATFGVTVVPEPVTLTVTAPANAAATAGASQTFALGSLAETNATAPYTVTVNWGDGSAATTFTMNGPGTITPQAHTFATAGSDTVSVTVADSAGHTSNTATFSVSTALGISLAVTSAADQSASPGTSATFALGSFTESGATAPYTVTVNWGDGSAATTFTMNGPGTITPQAHTFAAAGADAVSMTVTDSADHSSNTATFVVTVAGPVPSLVVTPPATELVTAGVAQTIVLGTLAETGATGPYTVTVNWGDGTAATTFSLAAAGTITAQPHTYAAAGSDTVSVTVTDAAGHTSNVATFTARVSNPVTVIAVTGTTNAAAMAGVAQLFDLGSFTATNATAPFTVSVNWGDGSAATTFTLAAPGAITPQDHTYALAGAHTIAVTVTDAAGHSSSAQTFTANVGNGTPSIAVTPPSLQAATAGTAETFPLGSFTETGGTAPYTVTVNWGDGSSATTFTMAGPGAITPQAHTYAAAGTDGVTVTVVDSAGVTSNPGTFAVDVGAPMTTTMVVTPPAAGAATAGVAGSFDLGQLAASNATTPFTVTVNWGDGTANGTYAQAGAGTITPEAHTYANVGTDVVTVTVTDSAGHTSNAATFTVSVAQAAASTGVTTVVVHVYDDPTQSGSTSTPAAGRVVFVDANGDGIYESDETAAITDATGTATLSIPDGQTSEIAEVLPTGVVQDLPSTSEVAIVGTGVQQTVNFFTFPLKPVASNTGQFWVNYPFTNLTAAGATFETDAAVTQPDGKVLVAGVETLNGVRSAFLARYFDDGEADLNFGTDGIARASAGLTGTTPVGLVVEPNGTIFLAANYASGNGTVAYIASFTPNGSTTASPFYESPVSGGRAAVGISLMPDGSLILAGSVSTGGVFATNVSQAIGQPVSSFGTNGTVTHGGATAMAPISAPLVNSTGGFYLVDRATNGSGASLDTFSAAGVLQSSVALPANIGTGYTLQSAALQPDGNIVISGVGQTAGGLSVVIDVARITPLGAADASFGTDGLLSQDETAFVTGSGTITVDDSTVLPSGTILVTGKYDYVPTTGTATYECFCQEYSSTGTVLLGFGQTNQIIVPTDTPFGMVALAKGSGVLPVVSATPAGDAAGPAFVDPSIGFHNTVVPPVIMLTGRSEADLDIETAAPTAVWQVPVNVTAATAAPEQLQVEFTDPVSIQLSTLGSDNLLVTLPDGTTELATYLGIAAGTAQDLYADYSVAAPGGTWTAADNGTYTVSLVAKTVANSNLSVAGVPVLGTFVVNVTNGTGSTGTDLPSTVTVAASVPSLKTGNIILFTATITGTGGPATGTVTFYNGTTVLGTGTVDGSGKAYYSTAALAGGTYNVTAVYSGDTTYVTGTTATAAPLTVIAPPAGAAQLTPAVSATLVLPASVIGNVKHKFSVPVTITNTGGATAKGQVTIVLYASLDGLLDATDVVVLTVRRNVNLKPGKSIKLKLNLTDLPASLSGGAYHLLAQVEDPSGFAQTAGTAKTVTVVAPVITPTLTFTRLAGSAALTAGDTTRASAVLALANDGNVPLSGAATFTIYLTASGTVTATSTQVVVVTRNVSVAAGKKKSVSVPLGTIPAGVAAGSYMLVAVVTTPAVNGAPAATATGVDSAIVNVG